MDRLTHDAAVAVATATLDVVKNCLRDEEWEDAWREFYAIAKAGIEAYSTMKARTMLRLNPTNN